MDSDRESDHSTAEEKLLAALLGANEELLEALRLYDDLERVGIERDAEERSRKETRMDRSVSNYGASDLPLCLMVVTASTIRRSG